MSFASSQDAYEASMRRWNSIDPAMREAIAFIASNPGAKQADVIAHVYPPHVYPHSLSPKRTNQAGRNLLDKILDKKLAWSVESVLDTEYGADGDHRLVVPKTRRFYPIAICHVHPDCVHGGLEIQAACAKVNPVTGWPSILPHVHPT